MEILNKRPEKMPYQKYKDHLRVQKAWLKRRLRGYYVWISTQLETDPTTGEIILHPDTGLPTDVGMGTFKGEVQDLKSL